MRPFSRAAVCAIALCASIPFLAVGRSSSVEYSVQARAGNTDEQQARAVCGVCYAVRSPDILPRAAWRDEFVRMMFIRENRLPPTGPPSVVYRTIQLPPDMAQVLPFFTSHAPERLPAPEPWPDPSESPIQFTRHGMTMP